MAMLGFNFNLLDQLVFYGSYHNNKWNQLIHFLFVPCILWSVMVWLSYTPEFGHVDLAGKLSFLPSVLASGFVLNWAAVVCGLYALYYLTLDFFAGLTWATFVSLPMWVTANIFQQHVDKAWAWALLVHVVGWYMQIHPGHAILEGRKPALLDSFVQSLVLAPLFVWYELLFLLGYRPVLQAQLKQRVEANIAAYKASKQPLIRKEEKDEKKEATATDEDKE